MKAHVIEGGKVVNTIEVESLDFMPNLIDAALGGKIGDLWDGSRFGEPPAVPTREDLKAKRAAAVAAITVTVNGKVFDGDEESQERMARALKVAEITGIDSCTWVLHDNSPSTVTQGELAQALALAMQEQGAIWVLQG